ncbi:MULTISPECIES: hypothetical protein [unclassified Pseudoxanthomonas]|uniref:hypothetical protein n=1 Tax=unclassified Pseudoxanthomonas TaxID=2645906 RepID=UPI00307895C5
MSTYCFFAQDEAGNRCKINVFRGPIEGAKQKGSHDRDIAPIYALEDGSRVRRVDMETFQVVPTGAYVTLVRD